MANDQMMDARRLTRRKTELIQRKTELTLRKAVLTLRKAVLIQRKTELSLRKAVLIQRKTELSPRNFYEKIRALITFPFATRLLQSFALDVVTTSGGKWRTRK